MSGYTKMPPSTRRRKKRRTRRRRDLQGYIVFLIAPVLVLALYFGSRAIVSPSEAENTESQGPLVIPDTQIPETQYRTDWNLILVNAWNTVPEGYDITSYQLDNGHAVDERCYPQLQKMMDACRAAGYYPVICSSYRSLEDQERLFDEKVSEYISQGYADAWAEAEKVVAPPGTSEHQLGLAVDIVDLNNQHLDETQEETAVQQWLMHNSWRYGFILRYPNEKSEITGMIYEPWHYRYVGEAAAKYIYENGLCLEEYLELLPDA